MGREWTVRTYHEGDEKGIYELFRSVYPSVSYQWDDWINWWRWFYQKNPAGKGLIWLAEADGRIIAQHALIPIRLKIGNRIVMGAWGVDAMTHPDYRRRQLFEIITKELRAQAAALGWDIEFGMPNEYSHPGLVKKLDWFDITTMKLGFRPLQWRNIIRLKVRKRLISGLLTSGASILYKICYQNYRVSQSDDLTISKITHFDDRFDTLWSKVNGQHKIMVVRDKDYLNWRFRIPGTQYTIISAAKADEVLGYLVLKNGSIRESKVSVIFDMMAVSDEVMHRLVSEAITISKQAGIDLIAYSLVADRTYRRVLRKNGFIFLPFVKGGYFCAYSRSTQINGTNIKDPKNWLVQTADSDVL